MFIGHGIRIPNTPSGFLFNPADLNPVAWYDFSDASLLFTDAGITPVSSDGDAIYQVNDKSASGFNLVQTTLAERPVYKTARQNGLSTSLFDGVDDFLNGGDILDMGTGNVAIFCVAKLSAAANQTVCGKSIAAGDPGRYSLSKASPNLVSVYTFGGNQSASIAFSDTGFNVLSSVVNRRVGSNNVYVNTSKVEKTHSNDTSNYDTTNLFLVGANQNAVGGIPPLAGVYTDGDIGEIVVLIQDATFTNTAITNMITYLNNKWSAF